MKVRSKIETNGHASFKKWRSIYSETSSVNGPSGRILGYRETRRNTETQYTQSGCTTRRGRFSMCSCRPREKEREDDFFLFYRCFIFFSRVTTHFSIAIAFFFLFLKSKRLSKAARTAYNRYRSRDRNSFTLFNVVVIVVVVVLREWKHERDGIDEYRCARCKVELFMGRLERVFCVIQF